jgi:hypothetical protein
MADFVNRVETLIMNAVTGTSTYTVEAASWVQLHDGDPGEDGVTNEIAGMARQEITSWNGSAGSRTNGNELQFPNSTGGQITVSYVSLRDASTSGNVIMKATLTAPVNVPDGQTGRFQIDQLTFSAD